MRSARDPFAILGIREDADPVVLRAAYRALSKKFHPDTNPATMKDECDKRMRDFNWAKEAIERDPTRARPQGTDGAWTGASEPSPGGAPIIVVEPTLIKLHGSPGAARIFTATAGDVAPSQIRARFAEKSWFSITRLDSSRTIARFAITVSREYRSRDAEPQVGTVSVSAPGAQSRELFVVIWPLLAQEYDGRRIVPTRDACAEAVISFGKHKGRTFSAVAQDDPHYLEWIIARPAGTELERESASLALKARRRRGRTAA